MQFGQLEACGVVIEVALSVVEFDGFGDELSFLNFDLQLAHVPQANLLLFLLIIHNYKDGQHSLHRPVRRSRVQRAHSGPLGLRKDKTPDLKSHRPYD